MQVRGPQNAWGGNSMGASICVLGFVKSGFGIVGRYRGLQGKSICSLKIKGFRRIRLEIRNQRIKLSILNQFSAFFIFVKTCQFFDG